MGLRELKKEQTRRRIADVALRLFAERGFDRVGVAEVAREAQVAEATLFNYFPTKEDLFYSGLEVFGAQLVDAVRSRAPGEAAVVACRRFLLGTGGQLDRMADGDLAAVDQMRTTHRVIDASPTLQAREHQVIARTADALAAVLAAELGVPPDDPITQGAANALLGVQRALIQYTRRRVLADDRLAELAADVHAEGTRAFDLVEGGLRDYAPRPDTGSPGADGEAR